MVGYNLTGIAANSTSIDGFFQGVNSITNNAFGLMILIGVSIVIFSSFYFSTRDVSKTMATTSFMAFLIAFFLKMVSMITGLVLYTTLVLAGIMLAFSFKKDK